MILAVTVRTTDRSIFCTCQQSRIYNTWLYRNALHFLNMKLWKQTPSCRLKRTANKSFMLTLFQWLSDLPSKKQENFLRNCILRKPFSDITVLCAALHQFQEDLKTLLSGSSGLGQRNRYSDSPGIESLWGRDFPHPSRPALGNTQPPIQWVPGLSRG